MTSWRDEEPPPVQSLAEAEEVTLHAARVYATLNGVRLSEALRFLSDELDRVSRDSGGRAALRTHLRRASQMLPPPAEAPLLHSGLAKLRATLAYGPRGELWQQPDLDEEPGE